MTAAKKEEKNLVAEAAKRALADANGDVVTATRMFELAVRESRELRDLLMEPLIHEACYAAVTREQRVQRKVVWQPPREKWVPGRVTGSGRVVQLSRGTLLMFPLPNGLPLGQAGREEVAAAEQFYASQSTDMSHKARWLQLIGQSVPDGKTVGDVLTDDRLRELQEEARNG